MTDNVFYKKGLHFGCKRCSFCCGHSPGFVYLSHRDLMALCTFFHLSIKEFVETKCRWADYYYGAKVLALTEKKNFDCGLWENGCSAYEARPIQCSTYPFWSWMLEDKQTWDDCAKDCPGMNGGRLWSFEEIEKNKKAYDDNIPLKKEEVEELIRLEENKIN
ncbi:MAG: YkgJ family cysteine cluster protein [Treponema sp.]|nr:YkgJ family cysteine cluster protein [Treponema sp.]